MPVLFHRHLSLGTFIYVLFILGIVGVIGAYGFFQARHVIDGPLITLIDEPAHMQNSPTITLTGTTENITKLTLNGRSIYTNDQGKFEETVVLPIGYTIVTLTAEDRYERVHSVERTFVRS